MVRKDVERHTVIEFGKKVESRQAKEFLDNLPSVLKDWEVHYLTKQILSITHVNSRGNFFHGKKPFEEYEGFMEDENKRSLYFRLIRESLSNTFQGLRFTSYHGYGWDDSMGGLIPMMDQVRDYALDFFKRDK